LRGHGDGVRSAVGECGRRCWRPRGDSERLGCDRREQIDALASEGLRGASNDLCRKLEPCTEDKGRPMMREMSAAAEFVAALRQAIEHRFLAGASHRLRGCEGLWIGESHRLAFSYFPLRSLLQRVCRPPASLRHCLRPSDCERRPRRHVQLDAAALRAAVPRGHPGALVHLAPLTGQGRAEPIRLAFEYAGADYVDSAHGSSNAEVCEAGRQAAHAFRCTLLCETTRARRSAGLRLTSAPDGHFAPPLLRIGDQVISQTPAILNFLGPRLGLAPNDEYGRAHVLQVRAMAQGRG